MNRQTSEALDFFIKSVFCFIVGALLFFFTSSNPLLLILVPVLAASVWLYRCLCQLRDCLNRIEGMLERLTQAERIKTDEGEGA